MTVNLVGCQLLRRLAAVPTHLHTHLNAPDSKLPKHMCLYMCLDLLMISSLSCIVFINFGTASKAILEDLANTE